MRYAHLVVVAGVLCTAPVRAGGIVLEAYVGERPADAPRVIRPVLDELVARGFNYGDTLAHMYEQAVSGSAVAPTGLPGDFAVQADAGFKAWVSGRFEEAIGILEPLVEAAHANSGAFARDQTLREPLQKALIGLALAHQRTGDPAAARASFAELVRSQPDATVSRALYGGEAFELFEQVRRELTAGGTGKLVVRVADDSAVVFVDEQYRGVGSVALDLLAGEYRICVMLNKQPARTHRVIVRPHGEANVAIDPRLDQAVRTAPWTGLGFASSADREVHEGPYAAAFASALGATAVAVVGIESVRGRPAVVGSLVSLETGRELRRASVALVPDPSTVRLRALARYLAGEEPRSGIEVQQPLVASANEPPARVERVRGRWRGWKWVAGAGGVVGLAAGGTLLALDGRCKNPVSGRACTDVYDNAPIDYIALGVGAALGGLAIYCLLTEDHPPVRAVYLVPTAGGGAVAGLGGRF
jgi:hypothetical protein